MLRMKKTLDERIAALRWQEERRQDILKRRQAGECLTAISRIYGITRARVAQIAKSAA